MLGKSLASRNFVDAGSKQMGNPDSPLTAVEIVLIAEVLVCDTMFSNIAPELEILK